MSNYNQIILTFVGSLFFGILLIFTARKLKFPSIVTLLIGGILLGPSAYGLHIITPASLGEGLRVIIQLAVGIVLFEGGLTLDIKGYRTVSKEIKRALSAGVLITWGISALSIKYIFDFTWAFSVLAASLIIVTGPTVIGPLLKRIGVKKNIHDFLHWESVLIDPVGVFISLLCFEWIIGHNAIGLFFLRILFGISFGLASGFILLQIIKMNWISDDIFNIFILGCTLAIFSFSNLIVAESGLLSVTIAGLVMGYSDIEQIKRLKIYKSQLVEMLIGLLFVLLAANLDIELFEKYYNLEMLACIAIIIFAIRPLNIIISTIGDRFNFREKIFLSWIAPRGIVAASMASIFTLTLKSMENELYIDDASFLEAFTYAVIACTVILQGFTAKSIGRLLKTIEPEPTGWVIISAHELAQRVAKFIGQKGFSVTMIDTNIQSIKNARKKGLSAILADAVLLNIDEYNELSGIGNVLAITENEALNELACRRWAELLNKPALYRWSHSRDHKNIKDSGRPIWSDVDLNWLSGIDEQVLENFIVKGRMKAGDLSSRMNILFCLTGGKLLPCRPDNLTGDCEFLAYYKPTREKAINIRPSWIIISELQNLNEVIMELLTALGKDYTNLNIEEIYSNIMTIESEFASCVGNNVILPHAYIGGISESIVLFAKMKSPAACTGSSEEIKFVFLILSPKNNPDMHIQTLSRISNFITSDLNMKGILNAGSKEELIQLFKF